MPKFSAEIRDKIIAAALTSFAEKGIHGSYVQEIAQKAGIATGSFYRYFSSKDELVLELHSRCSKEALLYASEMDDKVGSTYDRYRSFLSRTFQYYLRYREQFIFMTNYLFSPTIQRVHLSIDAVELETLKDIITTGQACGDIKAMPLEKLCAFTFGGLIFLTQKIIDNTDAPKLDEADEAYLVSLAWDAISVKH